MLSLPARHSPRSCGLCASWFGKAAVFYEREVRLGPAATLFRWGRGILQATVHLEEALVGFRGVDMRGSGWWFRRASDVMKAAGRSTARFHSRSSGVHGCT